MSSYILAEFNVKCDDGYGHRVKDYDNSSTEIDYHEGVVQKQVLRVSDVDLPLLLEALQLRLEDIKRQQSRGER